jgi:hypothetical protein
VSNWTYGFYNMDKFKTGTTEYELSGNYSIVFYDVFGEDWRTVAIQYEDDCDQIISALEGIPNDVIMGNSVQCLVQTNHSYIWHNKIPEDDKGSEYNLFKVVTLVFPTNVGKLMQPYLDIYLDGPRPTLVTDESTSTLKSFFFADGFTGEYVDYVPDYCEDVEVTLALSSNGQYMLSSLSNKETILLKRCLGDADGVDTIDGNNQNDVFQWDHGNIVTPHLIKLIETTESMPTTRICNSTNTYFAPSGNEAWCDNYMPAGWYAPLIYDQVSEEFLIYNMPDDYDATAKFRVFTTTGMLNRVNKDDSMKQNDIFSRSLFYSESTGTGESMDCETRTSSNGDCLDKGDMAMFFSILDPMSNVEYHNIYTIDKIYTDRNSTTYGAQTQIVLDIGSNFGLVNQNATAYKFYPPAGVNWAAECSDRGLCDSSSGLCQCFTGYTSDDCSVQNILAQ